MGFALSDMQLSSPAFESGGLIPTRHTAYGSNISPALAWTAAPQETESFAIFVHDPDAPLVSPDGTYGYVHWLVYNIPGSVAILDEGSAGLYTVGLNQNAEAVYFGPQPPGGHGTHHYFFWLLALTLQPDLPADLTLWQLLERVEPHVVAMNRLVGTYSQPPSAS